MTLIPSAGLITRHLTFYHLGATEHFHIVEYLFTDGKNINMIAQKFFERLKWLRKPSSSSIHHGQLGSENLRTSKFRQITRFIETPLLCAQGVFDCREPRLWYRRDFPARYNQSVFVEEDKRKTCVQFCIRSLTIKVLQLKLPFQMGASKLIALSTISTKPFKSKPGLFRTGGRREETQAPPTLPKEWVRYSLQTKNGKEREKVLASLLWTSMVYISRSN